MPGIANPMRSAYLLYFLARADYPRVIASLRCQRGHHPLIRMVLDSVWSSYRYGTSLNDYFNFRFFEKPHREREQFASMAFMYRFHRQMNDRSAIRRIDDKDSFRRIYEAFAPPSGHFDVVRERRELESWLSEHGTDRFVIKDPRGTAGSSVRFGVYDPLTRTVAFDDRSMTLDQLCKKYSTRGFLYVEPYLRQHPDIDTISPSGLNTVRVITVVTSDGEVDVVAAVFRVTVGSRVDNFSMGNLAAPLDVQTGRVVGAARKKMAACSALYDRHPITDSAIVGFQIPRWAEVLEQVREAALVTPRVRTVGWDVAVLEDRVVIIEGNSKWNKDTLQIPLQKGVRAELERYL